jgi:hypothetical protein
LSVLRVHEFYGALEIWVVLVVFEREVDVDVLVSFEPAKFYFFGVLEGYLFNFVGEFLFLCFELFVELFLLFLVLLYVVVEVFGAQASEFALSNLAAFRYFFLDKEIYFLVLFGHGFARLNAYDSRIGLEFSV